MIRTVAGTGYEFKAEVLKLRPEAGTRQADSEASSSRRDVLARWIARRPALASGVALTAGAVLTGTLVLVWSADAGWFSIREAAVLHALVDVGASDFRGLAPWYAFVHLLAARGAGVVPFLGMIAHQPGAAGERRQR
jgi:hypothetical protein